MRHHAAAPIISQPSYPACSHKLGLGDFPCPMPSGGSLAAVNLSPAKAAFFNFEV